jgi:hypothetical protein
MRSRRMILTWEEPIELHLGVLDGGITRKRSWWNMGRFYINEERHLANGGSLVLGGIAMLP